MVCFKTKQCISFLITLLICKFHNLNSLCARNNKLFQNFYEYYFNMRFKSITQLSMFIKQEI